MNYQHQLDLISRSDFELGSKLSLLKNLETIIRWISEQGLSLKQFDSIQQDEYNYDVTFPWIDHRWIAFGVT